MNKTLWKIRFVLPVVAALLAAIWFQVAKAEVPPDELRPFQGDWIGECVTQGSGPSSYVMELDVRDRGLGRYDWTIRYEGQAARRYIMLPQQARGHYVLDERNGILIDRFISNGTLRDQFEVGNSRVSTRTWIEGQTLNAVFETFSAAPIRETWSNDQKYRVRVFRPVSIATCQLQRR